jgi:hypothetical protein
MRGEGRMAGDGWAPKQWPAAPEGGPGLGTEW